MRHPHFKTLGESVTIHRIEPLAIEHAREDDQAYPFEAPRLIGHPILESKPLTEEQIETLLEIFWDGHCFGRNWMRCFFPGMGLTWENEEGRHEMVLCLRCQIAYYQRSGAERESFYPTPQGCKRLLALFAASFPEAAKASAG